MLKQRVLTAVVLAPLTLAGIFLLPVEGFAVFFAALTLLGAWEWSRLSGIESVISRGAYVAFVAALLAVLWWYLDLVQSELWLVGAALLWCVSFAWVLRYPKAGAWRSSWVRAFTGGLFLSAAWLSLVLLKAQPLGNAWLLLLLLIVWGADTGAYFSGKRWGSVKLAPSVSPGKTREGVYGGLVVVALVAVIFSIWHELAATDVILLVAISTFVAAVSVMGDLFESLLKRFTGIKDSGAILPGHGGILDRIDSVIAAAPFFYLGLQFTSLM